MLGFAVENILDHNWKVERYYERERLMVECFRNCSTPSYLEKEKASCLERQGTVGMAEVKCIEVGRPAGQHWAGTVMTK